LFLALTKLFLQRLGTTQQHQQPNAMSGAGTGAMSEATIVASIIAS
jgi:hypothetical protein